MHDMTCMQAAYPCCATGCRIVMWVFCLMPKLAEGHARCALFSLVMEAEARVCGHRGLTAGAGAGAGAGTAAGTGAGGTGSTRGAGEGEATKGAGLGAAGAGDGGASAGEGGGKIGAGLGAGRAGSGLGTTGAGAGAGGGSAGGGGGGKTGAGLGEGTTGRTGAGLGGGRTGTGGGGEAAGAGTGTETARGSAGDGAAWHSTPAHMKPSLYDNLLSGHLRSCPNKATLQQQSRCSSMMRNDSASVSAGCIDLARVAGLEVGRAKVVRLQGRGRKQVWALAQALVPALALALGWAQAPASSTPSPQLLQSSPQQRACLSQLSSSEGTFSCG